MKILVAADPSQHSREAIQFVKSVEWPKKSEIFLFHVIEMKHAPPIVPSGGLSSWDRVIAQVRGKMITEAKLFLDQTKKEILKQRTLAIKSFVVEGLPGAEILQAVKDFRIDLVILGTRGLSNIKRFLLGSTSDWVLREAPCSVLLVRGKLSRAATGKAGAKVLLASDGSSVAWDMIRMLGMLTCKIPPKVTMAHVVSRPAFLEGWYWGKGKAEFAQLAKELMAKAEKDGADHLREIEQRVQGLNMKFDTVLAKGDPAEEILKIAEALKAKLIMIGTQGVTESKPVPLGGVARKISRYAPCSVLITRPGRAETGE